MGPLLPNKRFITSFLICKFSFISSSLLKIEYLIGFSFSISSFSTSSFLLPFSSFPFILSFEEVIIFFLFIFNFLFSFLLISSFLSFSFLLFSFLFSYLALRVNLFFFPFFKIKFWFKFLIHFFLFYLIIHFYLIIILTFFYFWTFIRIIWIFTTAIFRIFFYFFGLYFPCLNKDFTILLYIILFLNFGFINISEHLFFNFFLNIPSIIINIIIR